MKISIIAAVAKNNVIGYKNKLPWKIPTDLKHFKEITKGHSVLIGQKTFESIGKPLPDRINIILTDKKNYKQKGCLIAHSIEEAIAIAKKTGEKELMIAGGASIYKQFISLADKIYLTKVLHKFEGDTFFPKIFSKEWKIVSKKFLKKGQENTYPLEFLELERK